MPSPTSRLTCAALAACATAIVAGSCAVSAAAGRQPPQVPPPSGLARPSSSIPPLVVEAVVVDKEGAVVTDMRAADFQVTVDGQTRRGVAAAHLFRGPGAVGLATAQQQTDPGGSPPRAEPNRIVVLVADQGSFLPGDGQRAQAVAEACLGLLGLGDRVMALRLPDLAGTQTPSADWESVRQALRLVQPLRAHYSAEADTSAAAEKRPGQADDPDAPPTDVPRPSPADASRATAGLDDLQSGWSTPGTEILSSAAVHAHAVEMLEGLRQLLVAMQPASVGSTVLLLSTGLIAAEAQREMEAVTRAAASAFARIYVIQVPTPSPRFADLGRADLMALARMTGGNFVTLNDRPAQTLQRLAGELSFSYLLLLAPTPADAEPRLHSVAVTTQRKDVTVRAGLAVRPGRVIPEQVAAPSAAAAEPNPPAAARTPKPPARRDPVLDALLERAADYLNDYDRNVSAVVAEEVYEQMVMRGWTATLGPVRRRLVSDFLLVQVPGWRGWLPFRDVFEVDGVQVRDRDDRLGRLFLSAPPERAVENGNMILNESARYNIGGLERNTNLPTIALVFLYRENQFKSTFTSRDERIVDGVRVREIGFREVARPTMISTPKGADLFTSGTCWVEPVSGRILRTQLQVGGATITVRYEPREETSGLPVPVRMEEKYDYPPVLVEATATYSKFRRFQVISDMNIKPPKTP